MGKLSKSLVLFLVICFVVHSSSPAVVFGGVSWLGDINGDGEDDFVAVGDVNDSEVSVSSIYAITSDGFGYVMEAMIDSGANQTIWSGVTNMGDIDGDGLTELVGCRNWRNANLENEVDLIQTDIPAYEAPLYEVTKAKIYDSTARIMIDISKMADNEVMISNILSGRGRFMSVVFDPNTGAYISLDTSWSFDASYPAYGVSYNGLESGEDKFYVARGFPVAGVGYGHVENWGSVSGYGTGIYAQYKQIQGMDLLTSGDPDRFVFVDVDSVYTYRVSTDEKSLIYSSSDLTFTGVSPIGNVNSDPGLDYVISGVTASGIWNFYVLCSSGAGYEMVEVDGTQCDWEEYTGVTNMGDIDSDGMLELAAVSNNLSLGGSNNILLLQTNLVVHVEVERTCADVWDDWQGIAADLNKDCYVNIYDLSLFADQWLTSNFGL